MINTNHGSLRRHVAVAVAVIAMFVQGCSSDGGAKPRSSAPASSAATTASTKAATPTSTAPSFAAGDTVWQAPDIYTYDTFAPFLSWTRQTVVVRGAGGGPSTDRGTPTYIAFDNTTGEQLATAPEPGAASRGNVGDGAATAVQVAGTGQDLLVDTVAVYTAAQGLTPGKGTLYARALTPRTLQQVWRTPIAGCTGCTSDSNNMDATVVETYGSVSQVVLDVRGQTATSMQGFDVKTGRRLWTNARWNTIIGGLPGGAVNTSMQGARSVLLQHIDSDKQLDELVLVDPATGALQAVVSNNDSAATGRDLIDDEAGGYVSVRPSNDPPSVVYSLATGAKVATVRGVVGLLGSPATVFSSDAESDSDPGKVTATDLPSGRARWTTPSPALFCAADADSTYVAANEQLVTLSTANGSQSTFDSGSCDDVPDEASGRRVGGLRIDVGDSMVTAVKL